MPDPLAAAAGGATPPEDPHKEHREQRHEFTLQYYQMSVEDLSRHLSIGWQTIALVAGTVAALSLGEQGHLPIPLAVATALAVAFWGILNIVDADYWATRAIAFLANVEAIYLSEADRKFLNPYVGRHPPFQMLDSLKYQFWAIVCFILLTLAYFVWKVAEKSGGLRGLEPAFAVQPWYDVMLWALPLVVTIIFLRLSTHSRLTRVAGYREFVESCPGPGLVRSATDARRVDLSDTPPAGQWTSGSDLQRDRLHELQASERFWTRFTDIVDLVGAAVAVGLIAAVLSRSLEVSILGTFVAGVALYVFRKAIRKGLAHVIVTAKRVTGL